LRPAISFCYVRAENESKIVHQDVIGLATNYWENDMKALFQTDHSYAYVVLRFGLAVTFFAHSTQQVLGWHGGKGARETLANWQQKYQIPIAIGVVGFCAEIFGWVAMTTGFLVRPAALGLAIFMAVAIQKAHWSNGFFLAQSHGKGTGIEFCLALFLMSLALFIGGAGAFSIDALLSR
jgi:putative oxidoreductase